MPERGCGTPRIGATRAPWRPARPAAAPSDGSRGRGGARRYTRPEARAAVTRPSLRRLFLNAKFFRNGIVMLVLVVGTVALLYTWLIQTPNTTPNGYSSF